MYLSGYVGMESLQLPETSCWAAGNNVGIGKVVMLCRVYYGYSEKHVLAVQKRGACVGKAVLSLPLSLSLSLSLFLSLFAIFMPAAEARCSFWFWLDVFGA